MISCSYQEKQEGGRERKDSTPDRHVERCLNTNRAGPKPQHSLLGAVEVKAVLQLEALGLSTARACYRTPEEKKNVEDKNQRMTQTGSQSQKGKADTRRRANVEEVPTPRLGKAEAYKMPLSHAAAWNDSYLPLHNQCLDIPTYRLPQSIPSSSAVVTARLQHMKQAEAGGRKQRAFS